MTPNECRAKYQQLLDDANKAYHDLMIGASARVVADQNGERVEFTAANKAALWAYIVRLQSAINSPDPCRAFLGTVSGPARFTF